MKKSKLELDAEYIKKLQAMIRQMLEPIRDIPFALVVESISEKRVIPFDKSNSTHRNLLKLLINAAKLACQNINDKGGIVAARVNEVGNKVEEPIKLALRQLGHNDADIPSNSRGKRQSTGYPDLGFTYNSIYVYVECKTFNKKNVRTTQRSFYFSPTEGFKVTRDAIHVVISLEMEREKYVTVNEQSVGIYFARGWKIVQIDKIDVDLKREFNSDNKRMYAEENILAEGGCA